MKRTHISGLSAVLFITFLVSTLWPEGLLAQPKVRFTQYPPDELDIAVETTIAWSSEEPDVEFRYKVEVPVDRSEEIEVGHEKWSTWGEGTSATYSDLIREGNYIFILEARRRGASRTARISTDFGVYFHMPEIYEEPAKIDWDKVNAAVDISEKYRSLSEVYRQACELWMEKYEAERKKLNLTWSGDQFIHTLSGEIIGTGKSLFTDWAKKGESASVSKVLTPKILYGIVKQSGPDPVRIYRNPDANRAAFSALGAYWAWKGYDELALEKREGTSRTYYTSPSTGMRFVLIPSGTFMMGSPAAEPGHYEDEIQHAVTITKPFYAGVAEVTQSQWKAVMRTNPSLFGGCGEGCAVEKVIWYEAAAFCNRLSERDGLTPAYKIKGEEVDWNRKADGYRLPTEAEWEYACRAGTTTPFNTGPCLSSKSANYDGNAPLKGCPKGRYRKKIVKVGSFAPNAWGLHDMHGNVWEWCWDRYDAYPLKEVKNPVGPSYGAYRVMRGGGWIIGARACRSARRNWLVPDYRYSALGFRVFRNAK